MPCIPFNDRFREPSDRETLMIAQLRDTASGLRAGHYAFVEMLCDRRGCAKTIRTSRPRCRAPALHLGPAQEVHADAIQDLAEKLLLGDAAYVARVERHDAMFRADVERGDRPEPEGRSMKTSRNDPFPRGRGFGTSARTWTLFA